MGKGDAGFDIHQELDDIVAKNILPKRVAYKIEKKIMENKITITKEQLHQLVDEIRSLLEKPEKIRIDKTSSPKEKTIIEQPKQESMLIDSPPRVVTTDEIQVSGETINTSQILQQNPLNEVPGDPESIIVLMNWLQFLIDKCGRNNLREVLDYYVAINWITEDVKFHLLEYSSGISEQKDGKERKNIRELPSQDHIQSFLFIQKLKGINLDKHFLDRINGEISRLVKQAEL